MIKVHDKMCLTPSDWEGKTFEEFYKFARKEAKLKNKEVDEAWTVLQKSLPKPKPKPKKKADEEGAI
jgi:hypothetical protein